MAAFTAVEALYPSRSRTILSALELAAKLVTTATTVQTEVSGRYLETGAPERLPRVTAE